jgi:hypothetical protein
MIYLRMVLVRRQLSVIIAYEFVMSGRTPVLDYVRTPGLAKVVNGSMIVSDGLPMETLDPDGDPGAQLRYMFELFCSQKVPPDLLERFCRIADAPDTEAAVVAFAKRWGLLGLCRHGLPPYHRRDSSFSPITGVRLNRDYCKVTLKESFQHWVNFARRFDSMRRIGLDLNRGKPGDNSDWELALADADCPPRDVDLFFRNRRPARVDVARSRYSTLMSRLMLMSHLHPIFQYRNGVWNLDMASDSYANLPAILTTQLMRRVASSKTMVKCRECDDWFEPRRNQVYCDGAGCGKKAAWRAASRRYADSRSR